MKGSRSDRSRDRQERGIRIQEGWVDRLGEHFTLTFGEASGDDFPRVARLAAAGPGRAVVEFLLPADHPQAATIRDEVLREVRYYLVEKQEPRPWAYLKYHCGTGANFYSRVHFGFWPADWKDREVTGHSSDSREQRLESFRRDPRVRQVGDPRRPLRLADTDEGFLLLEDAPAAGEVEGDAGSRRTTPCLLGFRDREDRARYLRQRNPRLRGAWDDEAEALAREGLPALESLLEEGRLDEAAPRLADLHDQLLDRAGGGFALLHLSGCEQVRARMAQRRGDSREAFRWLRESLFHARWAAAEGREDAARPLVANALMGLGQLCLETGRAAEALPLLLEALPDTEWGFATSLVPDGADRLGALLIVLGDALEAHGDPGQAEVLYQRALRLLRDLVRPDEVGERLHALLGLYERLGDRALLQDRPDDAMAWYLLYLDRAVAIPPSACARFEDTASRQASIAGACSRLTDACLKRDDLPGADRYSRHGLDALASLDPGGPREAERALADALNRRARWAQAAGHAGQAADLAVQAAERYGHLAARSGRTDDLLEVAHCWQDAALILQEGECDAADAWARALDAAKQLKRIGGGTASLWRRIRREMCRNGMETPGS